MLAHPGFPDGVLLHHALLQEVQGSDLGCSRPQVGHWPGLGSESELRLWTVVATRKSPIEVYNNGTYIGPFGRGILELISPLSSTIHPSLPPSLPTSIHPCMHPSSSSSSTFLSLLVTIISAAVLAIFIIPCAPQDCHRHEQGHGRSHGENRNVARRRASSPERASKSFRICRRRGNGFSGGAREVLSSLHSGLEFRGLAVLVSPQSCTC